MILPTHNSLGSRLSGPILIALTLLTGFGAGALATGVLLGTVTIAPPVIATLITLCLLLAFSLYKVAKLQQHRTQQLQLYREAIAATPFAIALYDANDTLVDYNSAYATVHQRAFEQNPNIQTYADLIRATANEFTDPNNIEAWVAQRVAVQRQGTGEHVDRLYPDGRWLRVSKHKTAQDAVIGYGIDITELKKRELELSDSEKRYQALTQVAPVGIWQIAQTGRTLFANNELLDIFAANNSDDFEKSLPLAKLCLYKDDELGTNEETCARLLRGKQPLYVEAAVTGRSEKTLYIARSKLLEDNDGEHSYMMVVVDVTQRKQAERDIRYLAEHDPLTGLANRSMLSLQLHNCLAKQQEFAVVLIDLDHFKDVNDRLGHQAGDRLIKEAATRIKNSLRGDDFASRLGGDEFAIVLTGIKNLKTAHSIVGRLYENFKLPLVIDDQVLHINASAGIALYPEHGTNSQELIQHADIALYHQKNLGRGSFTLFETALASKIQNRKILEQDLRRALASKQELSVNYQPQYALGSGTLTGVEALVRWQNTRTGKWVSPADFIPMAEQSGLIYALDKFVLHTAALQVCQWHAKGYGHLILASNLSTVHFRGDTLKTMIHEVLANTHINPARLELEITEGLFLEEQSHATEQLNNFRQQGIRVAVDDFGTGYSNLGYLNNLPVDCLKIDRSFINNFDKNDYYRSIVKFIIELGNNLKLDIIAEGIETQEQLDALTALKCSHGQGYFLGRPQTAEAITELLKNSGLKKVNAV